ncbi:MAG: GxxExxY protein [Rectinemataceae bacterium]
MDENELSNRVIGAAIEVHRHLGPGMLESAYRDCLFYELSLQGLHIEREKVLPLNYKGMLVGAGYRLDLIIEGTIIAELKSVRQIHAVHEAQLLTYLRLSGMKLGLLLNFYVPVMKQGIRRVVNNLEVG